MRGRMMKCKECEHIKALEPRNNGIRCTFLCGHKNQTYIYKYFRKHNIKKMPAFICYGGGLYGIEPTIKTSPAWCPLKKAKEVEE